MYTLRFKHKEIRGEFIYPAGADTCIILAEGLPSAPAKKELMFALAKLGFGVFYPRYAGTWESDGLFFAHSPTEDILEIADLLKNKGVVKELYGGTSITVRPKKVVVLGSSFGGSVALECATSPLVDVVIALAPPIDYKIFGKEEGEQSMAWLIQFLKSAFGNAYRFDELGVKKFLDGDLLNPAAIKKFPKKPILILQCKDDPTVNYQPVEAFANSQKLEFKLLNKGGHFSLSSLSPGILNFLASWLRGESPEKILETVKQSIIKKSGSGRAFLKKHLL